MQDAPGARECAASPYKVHRNPELGAKDYARSRYMCLENWGDVALRRRMKT